MTLLEQVQDTKEKLEKFCAERAELRPVFNEDGDRGPDDNEASRDKDGQTDFSETEEDQINQ